VSAAYTEPMTVQSVDGEVVVLGPDACAVALTPEAAEESARRLDAAAAEARQQISTGDVSPPGPD
jgi:hypothetical protein